MTHAPLSVPVTKVRRIIVDRSVLGGATAMYDREPPRSRSTGRTGSIEYPRIAALIDALSRAQLANTTN